MLNLSSTVDLDFMAFLRWWTRELVQLVPENAKWLLNNPQGLIVVKPESGRLRISYVENDESTPLATLDRNESSALLYQKLIERDEKFAKATVALRLTDGQVLSRDLLLPAAAKENLQQVIAYELDRYTPFKAEQVYFATLPKEGPQEPGFIKLFLVLTPRELLDGLYEDMRALSIVPAFADYEGCPSKLDAGRGRYNLLPEKYRQKTARTPFLIHSGLMALLALLFIGVMVLPILFQYQAVQVLSEKVASIEKEAKKIKIMQGKVDDAINETQQLLNEKTATPMMVALLDALSSLMKDDTSLTYLQYSDGHLQIQGESPSASTLIGILEDSELFNNARFVSPVTQDNVSKLERFQITVDITKKEAGNAKTK